MGSHAVGKGAGVHHLRSMGRAHHLRRERSHVGRLPVQAGFRRHRDPLHRCMGLCTVPAAVCPVHTSDAARAGRYASTCPSICNLSNVEMITLDVNIPPDCNLSNAETLIERCCERENLTVTLKGTLVQYPGCVHWHVKQGKERGTLEITLWPQARRLWFKMSDGRAADWIEPTMRSLYETLENKFKEST